METGTPYLLYKDHVNNKTNQKNVGIIRNHRCCSEITEYSDENETAVCNLASIGLPSFVLTDASGNSSFDFLKNYSVSKVVTANLNRIIDVHFINYKDTLIICVIVLLVLVFRDWLMYSLR